LQVIDDGSDQAGNGARESQHEKDFQHRTLLQIEKTNASRAVGDEPTAAVTSGDADARVASLSRSGEALASWWSPVRVVIGERHLGRSATHQGARSIGSALRGVNPLTSR
jgi:hypothetical protein